MRNNSHYNVRQEKAVEDTALTPLAQSATAYQKALQFEPDSYHLYESLARVHTNQDRASEAEAVYLRALDAPLTQSEHEAAIQATLDALHR